VKLCACYRLFNGATFIESSMKSIYEYVERIVIFFSRRPWYGPVHPPDGTEEILDRFPDPENKIVIVRGDWRSENPDHPIEVEQSNELLDFVRDRFPEMTHYFFVDYDEVYHPEHLRYLRHTLETSSSDVFRAVWRCYWRSIHWWIDPPEPSRPLIAFRIRPEMRFTDIRQVNGTTEEVLPQDRFIIHHFSYALTGDEVARKIRQWSHAGQIVPGWYRRVWQPWPRHRMMINLHPCWPTQFGRAIPADPELLPTAMHEHPYFGRDVL
jgi:hypothetical protein